MLLVSFFRHNSPIEQLYLDKAENVNLKLEQTTIRDAAQAKIDAYDENIQRIDSKLFDAINGTSTGTGLEQGTLSALQTGAVQ